MSLQSQAVGLSKALNTILAGLCNYALDDRRSYTQAAAQRLGPLVEAFEHAVTVERSRQHAEDLFAMIKQEMEELSAAKCKGDINFVEDVVLDKYWELKTIFQESRYRDSTL